MSEQQKGRRCAPALLRSNLLVLALLVGDGAGSLASGLARGLALAAATLGGAGLQSGPVESLDMFHFISPPVRLLTAESAIVTAIITQCPENFNHLLRFFFGFPPSRPGIAPPHRLAHKIPVPPLATEAPL